MKRCRDKMKTDTDKYEQMKKRDKERGVLDTTLCDKVCQWLAGVCGFILVLWFPPPIKLMPRYNRNVVESGVKHHKPTNHTGNCRFFRSEFIFK